MSYFLDNYPVSENCANLVLTEEQEKYCRVVYKINEKGDAYFSGFWNPDEKYSDENVVVPVRSTGATPVRLTPNSPKNKEIKVDYFANVEGSGQDPQFPKYNGWLGLWCSITKNGFTSTCRAQKIFFYNNDSQYQEVFLKENGRWISTNNGVWCRNGLDGAHILLNTKDGTGAIEGGDNVYIIPLCKYHNRASNRIGGRFGTGFYMKLLQSTDAVQLTGYLRKIKQYIDDFKDDVRHE